MNPITGVLLGLGAISSIVGSYLSGESNDRNVDKQLAFERTKLDAELKMKAQELGLTEAQMNQAWTKFTKELKENKRQFDLTYGLSKEELGLKKESLAHTKYMDTVAPIVERARRSRNLISTFSNLAAMKAPANPMTAAPATNPVSGFAPTNPQAAPAPANPIVPA